MNVLGHPYVAYRVFGKLDGWLVAGSWLPDLVPFVPGSVFEFEEIHEGGERFLKFLDRTAPDRRGLALGMLAHGVKFGADKFSRDVEEQFELVREELARKIADSTGVSLEVARKHRFHNYLWWGIGIQILRHEKEFMGQLLRIVPEVDTDGISNLLAGCFNKSEPDVRRMLNWAFNPLTPENLSTASGLVCYWKCIAAGLPERDQVDIKKTVEVFNYCADLLEGSWRDILDNVVEEVCANLRRFKWSEK